MRFITQIVLIWDSEGGGHGPIGPPWRSATVLFDHFFPKTAPSPRRSATVLHNFLRVFDGVWMFCNRPLKGIKGVRLSSCDGSGSLYHSNFSWSLLLFLARKMPKLLYNVTTDVFLVTTSLVVTLLWQCSEIFSQVDFSAILSCHSLKNQRVFPCSHYKSHYSFVLDFCTGEKFTRNPCQKVCSDVFSLFRCKFLMTRGSKDMKSRCCDIRNLIHCDPIISSGSRGDQGGHAPPSVPDKDYLLCTSWHFLVKKTLDP